MGKSDPRRFVSVPHSPPRRETLSLILAAQNSYNTCLTLATWFIPCSSALLICHARREWRKRTFPRGQHCFLLAAFFKASQTLPFHTLDQCSTSRALIQTGTENCNFIPPITLSTKGHATISPTPSSCIPWDICFRGTRFMSRDTPLIGWYEINCIVCDTADTKNTFVYLNGDRLSTKMQVQSVGSCYWTLSCLHWGIPYFSCTFLGPIYSTLYTHV